MDENKIEPTDAMVDEAANAVSMEEMDTPLHLRSDLARQNLRNRARTALRAALNHPDAPGLFADEDATRAAREQGWDEAAEWGYRTANLGHSASKRIKDANPYRRIALIPPAKDGAQIIPAYEAIEAARNGVTYTTDRAIYDGAGGVWVGIWRGEDDHSTYEMHTANITPNTWRAV